MSFDTARSSSIHLHGITKRYGALKVLDNIDLSIASGEFLTLLGPSGSGKSTLLMALAGFVLPDNGKITFGETDVTVTPPHKRNVGMVFQNYALFPHMTVLQNVMYPMRIRGVHKATAKEKARHALSIMQMTDFDERQISQLSGGQQQRVALARAIVFEPPILLMDEPLSALDKKLREAMQIEIRKVHERVGATTVYVTHDQHEALALSDRIAVIAKGKLVQVAAPGQLYNSPENLFVADFIGDSHILPVARTGTEVALGGRILRHKAVLPPSSEIMLVLRPEKLSILPAAGDADNVIEGVVTRRVFLGDSTILLVNVQDVGEISAKLQTRHTFSGLATDVGETIRLGFQSEDVILLPARQVPS